MKWLPILLLLAGPAAAREPARLPELANRPAGSAAIPGCSRDRLAAGRPLPFGCASRLNLEAMLEDPGELVEAARLAPAQGDIAIRAQEDLLRGAPAAPPADSRAMQAEPRQ